MDDIWTDIKDAPGYQVSRFGRVRNKKTGRVLRPHLDRPNGYERVNLYGRHRYIHKLMIENIYDYELKKDEFITHIDKKKDNNVPYNLKIMQKKARK